jgi:hypothetical protein
MSVNQNFPEVSPSLLLDFANSRTLDPRITFERSSIGTYVASNGLIKTAAADEPRFDHDPETGESLGLLIEESRTNIAPYGNNMSLYSDSNINQTANDAVAPDGTTTATKLEWGGGSNTWYLDYLTNITAAGAGTYTYSVWVKAPDDQPDDYYVCRIAILHSTGGNIEQIFSIGKNWRRISITKTFGASDPGNVRIHPIIFRNSPGNSDNAIGIVPSYVWVWGSQLEKGSFPTSYIPTSGSEITRQPDKASITGTNFSDWFNPIEGTSFIDLIPKGISNSSVPYQTYFSFNSNSANRWGIAHQNGSVGTYAAKSVIPYVGFAGAFDLTPTLGVFTSGQKMSLGMYQPNGVNVQSVRDGGDIQSVNTTKNPSVTNLLLGGLISDNSGLMGHISKFTYYPQRLTDSQLQNLTK